MEADYLLGGSEVISEAAEIKKEYTKAEIDEFFSDSDLAGIVDSSDETPNSVSSEMGAIMELLADGKLKFDTIYVVKINAPISKAQEIETLIQNYYSDSEISAYSWDNHKNISFLTMINGENVDSLINGLYKNQDHPIIAKYLNVVGPKFKD